jgi:hypothetical protein
MSPWLYPPKRRAGATPKEPSSAHPTGTGGSYWHPSALLVDSSGMPPLERRRRGRFRVRIQSAADTVYRMVNRIVATLERGGIGGGGQTPRHRLQEEEVDTLSVRRCQFWCQLVWLVSAESGKAWQTGRVEMPVDICVWQPIAAPGILEQFR